MHDLSNLDYKLFIQVFLINFEASDARRSDRTNSNNLMKDDINSGINKNEKTLNRLTLNLSNAEANEETEKEAEKNQIEFVNQLYKDQPDQLFGVGSKTDAVSTHAIENGKFKESDTKSACKTTDELLIEITTVKIRNYTIEEDNLENENAAEGFKIATNEASGKQIVSETIRNNNSSDRSIGSFLGNYDTDRPTE